MSRGRHATKANASAKLKAWRMSPRCKAMLLEAGLRGLAIARTKPRCGAKTRSGEPCRGYAMTCGKCRMHGGATPSGAAWHKIKMPARGEVRGVEKFEAKLAAKEKRDARRRQKLAAMTPEQRASHAAWQATHTPGGPGERAHRRRQRETKKMLEDLQRAGVAREAADEPRQRAAETVDFRTYNEGVFG